MIADVGLDNSTLALLNSYNKTQDQMDQLNRAVATGYDVNQASDDPFAFYSSQALRNHASGYRVVLSQLSTGKLQLDKAQSTLSTISATLDKLKALVTGMSNTPSYDEAKSTATQALAYVQAIKALIDGGSSSSGFGLGTGNLTLNLSPDSASNPWGSATPNLLTLTSPGLSVFGAQGLFVRPYSSLPKLPDDSSIVKMSDGTTVWGQYLYNVNGKNGFLFSIGKFASSLSNAQTQIGTLSNVLDTQIAQVTTNQNSDIAQADALTKTDITATRPKWRLCRRASNC